MTLSKKLLLALAGTGLVAPMAASANELASLGGNAAINEYMQQQDVDRFRAWESKNQVTSVNQFSDVQPTDWAYQALSNLVGNAVQHGGAATPIVVSARGEPDEVVLAVQNRGALIPDSDRQHIFDPFKRIASAEKAEREQGSLGLGLYIAQQIAIAHGGRIDVESSEELGTTFQLHLPRSA